MMWFPQKLLSFYANYFPCNKSEYYLLCCRWLMIRLLSSGQFALPIKHITTDGKLSKHAGDPLAELGGTNDVHAIAHANDSVEIVELKCSVDISISFASNYRDFLGSCLFFEFFALIDVLQMKPNVICRTIEQHPHGLLGAPYDFILIVHLNTLFFTFYLENQELSCTVSYLEFLRHKRLNQFFDNYTCRKVILLYSHLVVIELAWCAVTYLFNFY